MPETIHASWPLPGVPWPPRDTRSRAELAKVGAETIFALGTSDGTVTRIGSGADPREGWTRAQRASAAPLVVHDLRWAQGRFGLKLARAVQRAVGADVVDVAAYRRILDAQAGRLGIVLAGHVDFLDALPRGLDRQDRELTEKMHGRMTDGQYEDHLAECRRRSADWKTWYAADKRREARARRRDAPAREVRQLEGLICRYGSGVEGMQ